MIWHNHQWDTISHIRYIFIICKTRYRRQRHTCIRYIHSFQQYLTLRNWLIWGTTRTSIYSPLVFVRRSEFFVRLTHLSRVTDICVSNLTVIGSDDGLIGASLYLDQWWGIVNWNFQSKHSVKSWAKCIHFCLENCIWECRFQNGGP